MTTRYFLSFLAFFSLLALAGCGGPAGAAPKSKPTASAVSRVTATSTEVVAAPVDTPTTVPVTIGPEATSVATADGARPAATSVPPTRAVPVPVQVVSASLWPAQTQPGGSLAATVITRGDVSRAELYLGSGSPTAAGPRTVALSPSATGTWSASAVAPTAPGSYHYTVGLFNSAGRRMVVDNDAWNVQVSGPPTAAPAPAGAQPLPGNVPLAPPFSYGNPIAATFTAEGQTVNGSEVVSNSRPDVPSSAIADFYNVHFPRSGWVVDQPAAGGASFTAAAHSGSQVCVVVYSGGAVHIFYGTISP